MSRRVVITGLGPVSGLGLGIKENWAAVSEGRSAVKRIGMFDPSGFDCHVGGEIAELKVKKFVPKSYRKATKVMARDIEMAVVAADFAAKDAALNTPGTMDNGDQISYSGERISAQIGAGLIAADINELTMALADSKDEAGEFDIHKWGQEGMQSLTPLWLLKYLPNMLASHVAIIHDTQGPSNTITCGDSSSGLSIGESLRVIQRGSADAGFCGGAESKLNLMAYMRQELNGRLTKDLNGVGEAGGVVKVFDEDSSGTVLGEGGGIVVLEALEMYEAREKNAGHEPYAEVVGFGASQTVHKESRNLKTDPEGRAIASAIRAALNEGDVSADEIDVVYAYGSGIKAYDVGEAAALKKVFGERLSGMPIVTTKALVGNCGAGGGGFDVCIAAKSVKEGLIPAVVGREKPIEGMQGNSDSESKEIRYALVLSTGVGGQNTAILLKNHRA
ncbi:3-oxoacyl-[acyl-carrier-protein] synthase 2 [Poriferisphaera corsica]|uniref:3-oxoacyl-[acyl-carrier-protein] synthase 2 n=1 Tax=Poriferisphaera corsica TaxID=2528020 RepID=A0A517YXI3_9BACT|nr:beta-ketoacyl synthase [Poriferisphaera corsica]QDU34938.1 3-oxoacyl-[acyl-carrier-protein] synthase 2 [Poriferisphaera corsica]